MPNWKHTLKIADLHQSYKDGNIKPDEIGKQVAKRILALKKLDLDDVYPHGVSLREIADDLQKICDIDDYDALLNDLYDWSDHDQRLWVEAV